MVSIKPWLFRLLVAMAAGLMVVSAVRVWWTGEIIHTFAGYIDTIKVYQYGVPRAPIEIAGDITPLYQIVLAWAYIAASVGLMLWSTWLKGKKGQLLLGGIGLIYIAYAAIAAFVVISGRLADFGASLLGWSDITIAPYSEPFQLFGSLHLGYYLAYAAGGVCIVLALLRNMIVGKSKISAG